LNLDGAIATLERAETVSRTAVRLAPRSRDCQLELLRVLVLRSVRTANRALWRRTQDERVRRDLAEESLVVARKLATAFAGDPEVIVELGSAQFSLAATYESIDMPRAVSVYRDALETFRQMLARAPEDLLKRRNVAKAARALGVALLSVGNLSEARTCLREALAIDESLLAGEPGSLMRAMDVSFDLSSLFTVAGLAGDWNEAIVLGARTARIREEIVRRDPTDINASVRLWYAYTNILAEALIKLNRPAEALGDVARARALEARLPDGTSRSWLARARYNEGRARELTGDRKTSCALFQEAEQIYSTAARNSETEEHWVELQAGMKRCATASSRTNR
jgi:tetratricopeptide (TPR) repeat protein